MPRVGWAPAFIGLGLILSSLIIVASALVSGPIHWLTLGVLVGGATLQWWRVRAAAVGPQPVESLGLLLLSIVFFGLAAPRLEAIELWLRASQ